MKLRKSVFLLSSLMMLSVGVGFVNGFNGNTVNVAEAAEATEKTATITFDASKTQRTSFSTTQQVWESNGVTFTNDKASSSNNVADYGNPVRLYQNSSITITAPGNITKIEFVANSSSYATTLKGSIGASATVSGSNVTWQDVSALTTYTCAKLTAQVRLNSLTVTYTEGGEVAPIEEAYILFDAGDYGSLSFEDDYTTNLKYTLPEPVVDSGWLFTGWYDESDEFVGGANEEVLFNAGSEVLLTAKYEEIPEGMIYDVLNQSFTGITSSSYTGWSGKVGTSGAVYDGLNAGSYQSIQLRSDTEKNYSGVISRTSAGYVRSIICEFASNTASGRTVNVYGSDSPYTEVADLYDTSKQGDLLGTIKCGTNDSIDVVGDYEYVGFRSASGALYISEIQIGWESAATSEKFLVTIDGGEGEIDSNVKTSYEGTTGETIDVTLPTLDKIKNPYSSLGINAAITFTSKLGTHNPGDVVKVSEKVTFTAVYSYEDVEVTIAQALAICEVAGEENSPFNVTVSGTISEITTEYDETYGNVSVKVTDDTGTILAFRLVGGSELEIGNKIKVTGKVVNYKSNTPEFAAGCTYVSLDSAAKMNYQYDDDTTPTAVRFIGTVENVDVTTVESVTLHFVKDGVAANKDVEVYTLYTSVAGQAEFAEAANTYYVVYVLNGVQSVLNQELEVTMTVTFNNGAEALVATRTFTLGA